MMIFLVLISLIILFFWLFYYEKDFSVDYDSEDKSIQWLKAPELPDWIEKQYPFNRKFVKINGIFIHYVDQGEENAPFTVLMIHGNPTWSFLWRKVISQLFMKKSIRIIVPDIIGFGLSSKISFQNLFKISIDKRLNERFRTSRIA